MLPEALSNELCSLKPNVDRLTKCVEFLDFRRRPRVEDEILSGGDSFQAPVHLQGSAGRFAAANHRDAIERMLHDANALAQKIRRLRFKAGSLDLDFPEMKIRLDEHGKISRIERIENDVSHQLIEEYMLAQRSRGARPEKARNSSNPPRSREPGSRKARRYRQFALSFGYKIGDLTHRAELQRLLAEIRGKPEEQALKVGLLLKSQTRAV